MSTQTVYFTNPAVISGIQSSQTSMSGSIASLTTTTTNLQAQSISMSGAIYILKTDSTVNYTEGVASGDPTQTAVIIWSRVTHINGNNKDSIPVVWEVSTSSSFSSITKTGFINALWDNDFTIKVDVTGLTAGTTYYYRFWSVDPITLVPAYSPIGITKTLPAGSSATGAKFAIVNCASYQNGLFNVYDDISKSDVDLVIHQGDYIYEYSSQQSTTSSVYNATGMYVLGRLFPSTGSAFTVEEFRQRYRQTRRDPMCKAVHAAKPFIAIWDDHEVRNDWWSTGALGTPASTGDNFIQLLDNAKRVYFEYMPIRSTGPYTGANLYRSFNYGNLVSIVMLDTRLYKDTIYDRTAINSEIYSCWTGALPFTGPYVTNILDPTRTMLGATQENWLTGALFNGSGSWQLVVSTTNVFNNTLPIEIAQNVSTAGAQRSYATGVAGNYANAIYKLSTGYAFTGTSSTGVLTQSERNAITQPKGYLYSYESWDAYPAARGRLCNALLQAKSAPYNKKVCVSSGDSHTAFYSDLVDLDYTKMLTIGTSENDGPFVFNTGTYICREYSPTSITSVGPSTWGSVTWDLLLKSSYRNTTWMDGIVPNSTVSDAVKGYVIMSFDPVIGVSSVWKRVSTIASPVYSTSTIYSVTNSN